MPFDWPPKAPRVEGDREKQTGGWWFSLFFRGLLPRAVGLPAGRAVERL